MSDDSNEVEFKSKTETTVNENELDYEEEENINEENRKNKQAVDQVNFFVGFRIFIFFMEKIISHVLCIEKCLRRRQRWRNRKQ